MRILSIVSPKVAEGCTIDQIGNINACNKKNMENIKYFRI